MARMPLSQLLLVTLTTLPAGVFADAGAVTSATPTVTSMLKLGLMLGLVLFMFVGFAWILKRMTGLNPRGGEGMKVTGGISLGQRERLVVVDIEGQRLVLGVTQQNIHLIKELPGKHSFDATLKQAMPEHSA